MRGVPCTDGVPARKSGSRGGAPGTEVPAMSTSWSEAGKSSAGGEDIRERDATRLGCQFRAGLMASLHMIKSRLATTASEPMSTRYESADEFSLVEEPFIPGGYPLFTASALPHHSSSLKSLLPCLWDILSSPSRSPPRPDELPGHISTEGVLL